MCSRSGDPAVRLTGPLVRDRGRLRPASWEEALDRAGEGIRCVLEEHGPDAFGMLVSTGATNEQSYVAQKFARVVVGTNNIGSYDRGGHTASEDGLAAVFGTGGATSSSGELARSDVVVLWGDDGQEPDRGWHDRVSRAVRGGARLFVVAPHRTDAVACADRWLRPWPGGEIPLAAAVAREIIDSGLADSGFVARATAGYERFAAAVEPWTPAAAERRTGVPAESVRELAHAYALADRAQLVWTSAVTDHPCGTERVLALCNLGLLTGQVGRFGAGLGPMPGRSNARGGADMGAVAHRLPGSQDMHDPDVRARFERVWGAPIHPEYGLSPTEMGEAVDDGQLRTAYLVGEDPVGYGRHPRAVTRLSALDHLVVQDSHLTGTARCADVVLPAGAGWCLGRGTVVDGERRVRRVGRAVPPPEGARDGIDVMCAIAARLDYSLGFSGADPERIWDELRAVAPEFAGISYARLAVLGNIRWPCPTVDSEGPDSPYLHGRLWRADERERGEPARFRCAPYRSPAGADSAWSR